MLTGIDPGVLTRIDPPQRIGMDCKEVCVERVVVRGTEWQPVAPLIKAIVRLSTDMSRLDEARVDYLTASALTIVLG